MRAYRRSLKLRIPAALTSLDRWVRAVGKRPVQPDGSPASSTDPSTWSPWSAVQSGAGDGYGIMLGDGLACWDLDHILDRSGRLAQALPEGLDLTSAIWVEVSCSGEGLHVFVWSEAPSRKRPGVEFYSRARFVRVTGRRWPQW